MKEKKTQEDELNKEYVSLIKKMMELNIKRHQIIKKFLDIKPDFQIRIMKTTSFYYDLFDNKINK